LLLADVVVVPVTPSGADLVATAATLELVRAVRETRRGGRPVCFLVPSRVDRRTASGREIESALVGFSERPAPAIGQRAAFVDAFTAGQWVGQFAPASKAAAEIAALARTIRRAMG
jgi:chromosome partitioning protein